MAGTYYSKKKLYPGLSYTIANRDYYIPTYMKVSGDAYILHESIIEQIRALTSHVVRFLNSINLMWWLSGGSLLGCTRNKIIPSPFDDDVDIHIRFEDKEILIDELSIANLFGLKPLESLAFGVSRSTSAIRFSLLDSDFPVLDIFFVNVADSKVAKIDCWNKTSLFLNSREVWDYQDIFPIQENVFIDGLQVNIPSNPEKVLIKQYGEDCMHHIVARPIGLSHVVPHYFFQKVFLKSKKDKLNRNVEYCIGLFAICVDKLIWMFGGHGK